MDETLAGSKAWLDRVAASFEAAGQALDRLREGTYGRCERCGSPLEADRLDVDPLARECAGCSGSPSERRPSPPEPPPPPAPGAAAGWPRGG